MAFKVDGVDYSVEGINALREEVIQLRDSQFAHWPQTINATVVLTHAVALLAYLSELLQEQKAASG